MNRTYSRATILIVEDDRDIMNANCAALELEGYRVFAADTLAKGRQIAEATPLDLIILDVLLPDGNGLSYCEELRAKNDVRILFLSALNAKADVLKGLRAGGDDYIAKPYDLDELLARVEALLRRGRLNGPAEPPLCLGGLELDPVSRRALLDGRDILLKPKEFALLEVLMGNHDRFVSPNELYEKVWGMQAVGDARTVKEHISRLRSKLGTGSILFIQSERGRGYRLEKINRE